MVSDVVYLVIFLRRFIGLIFTPYTTMRNISVEKKWQDILWIGIACAIYFFITSSVRGGITGLLGAIGLFTGSVLFFSLLPSRGTLREKIQRMCKTWVYTLLPTLIWFYSTLLFYFILPPPRTASFLGKAFSIFYIAFSGSLLVWKLILVYLSIRFSLRVHLYRVIYYILIYLALSIPLWVLLYKSGISRVPFV
ncbi:MAG: hypothetical protein V1922_05375 [bacterium]